MSLTVDAIRKAATDKRDRLRAIDRWAIAYRAAEPEEPLLVKATPPTRDYYIVEFRQAGRTTGLMLVNPDSGKIGAITGIQTSGQSLFRFVRPDQVAPLLEAYGHQRLSTTDFSATNVRVQPVLFWQPSDQSLTPFRPFYRVEHVRPDRSDHFLVRVDGEIYDEKLTRGGRGL